MTTGRCEDPARTIRRPAPDRAARPRPSSPTINQLTHRELEVVDGLVRGLTNKQNGQELGISHRTVEIYRTRLMRKYGAESSSALVQKLLAGGSSLDIVLGPDEV